MSERCDGGWINDEHLAKCPAPHGTLESVMVPRIAEILERYFPSPADRRMRLLAAAEIVGDFARHPKGDSRP